MTLRFTARKDSIISGCFLFVPVLLSVLFIQGRDVEPFRYVVPRIHQMLLIVPPGRLGDLVRYLLTQVISSFCVWLF